MSHLRLVLAWLIMLAIPVQGLAAANMAFCGSEHHTQRVAVAVAVAQQHAGHDHSAHVHVAAVEQSQVEAADAAAKLSPEPGQKCSLCASCCPGVALTQGRAWPELVPLQRATLSGPFVVIHTAHSEVPDKPPRA